MSGPPGRTVLVTGASSGIGFFAARELARAGVRVLLGSRDAGRGARAARAVRDAVPGADLDVVALDLADLASVHRAADELVAAGPLDGVLANAGVTSTHGRRTSAQGSELMLATNHLGHFALVGRLMPALAAGEDARVVGAGSIAHRFVRPPQDATGWQSERGFSVFPAYSRSKLAVLLHTAELDRRLRAAGSTVTALAFHPGYAVDLLDTGGPQDDGGPVAAPGLPGRLLRAAAATLVQGKEGGARPAVRAVLDASVPGGSYLGPGGLAELAGAPRPVRTTAAARDPVAAAQLWQMSEELTGVRYPL